MFIYYHFTVVNMNSRGDRPEESTPSPEFIKVSYDKYGNAIDVKPVDGQVDAHNGFEIVKNEPTPKVNIHSLAYDTKVIGNWLNVLNQNMYTIREHLKNSEGSEKIIPLVEQISNSISIFQKNFNEIHVELDSLRKIQQDAKAFDNSFLEQLNLLRENLRIIHEEMSDNRHVSNLLMNDIGALKNQVNEASAQIQNSAQQMHTNSMQIQNTSVALKEVASEVSKMKDEIKNLRFDPSEILEAINSINNNFEILRNHFVEMDNEVTGMINQMNAKISDLSWKMENIATKEDLDMVISGFISKQELHQTKNELENEIKGNHINREELVSQIVTQTTTNMQKLLQRKRRVVIKKVRKIKLKKKRKILKRKKFSKSVGKTAKINKSILTKKLMKADITTYPSTLIVTERRMQKVGRAVFDVAKTLNKNVLMIMQDKIKDSDSFGQITYDAMKNSDAIFLVSKENMRKNPSLKMIKSTKKVFTVNNKMKFSQMN